MSTEMQQSALSTKIDMFALGSTYWAMVELSQPFEDTNPSLFWVADFIISGKRLPLSEDCPGVVRDIIRSCWDGAADSRPDAQQVMKIVGEFREGLGCG